MQNPFIKMRTRDWVRPAVAKLAVALWATGIVAPTARAAIVWDAEAGTQWWFNPVNWNVNMNANNVLPPNGGSAFDAQINVGTAGLPGGEGVVYDPANDPHFDNADNLPYPADRGPQIIDQLYISRNTTNHNLLTIKGDLTSMANVIVGRSGSALAAQNEGRINQLGGVVRINNNVLDMGQREASGWGNGIYDFRGGTLEVSLVGGSGIRLSAGGSAGPGGHGRFIMRNPNTGGYVRTYDFTVAANAGTGTNLPDGDITGVGIVEFHFENDGTRPIQVDRNLIINNGMTMTGAVRSSRLELVLDEPPTVDVNGVPENLGLFDVDFAFDPLNPDNFQDGAILGAGDLGLFFSNGDGAVLPQDAMVSATFGSTTYNWQISYTGNITWTDAENSVVDMVSATGGEDVVLIGLSSMSAGLPGDYNDNGVVDAADYTVWRDTLGGTSLVNEGASTGIVDQADYDLWKQQFGELSAGAGSGLSAAVGVPEPSAWVIVIGAVLLVGLVSNRPRRIPAYARATVRS